MQRKLTMTLAGLALALVAATPASAAVPSGRLMEPDGIGFDLVHGIIAILIGL